jgi:hypothetical protein
LTHVDFKGWQFISKHADGLSFEDIDPKNHCLLWFVSGLFRQKRSTGGIKPKMNGYMQPIGIVSFLTNTILELGEKMPKIYLKQKAKRN